MPRPADVGTPLPVSKAQLRKELGKILLTRRHMGVRNFLGDILLEARNPFQKIWRYPQRWVVASASVLILGLALVYYFHLK